MASTFPGAIDNFTDPLANSSLASPSHAGQHSDLNDAVEKVEQYMGLVKVIPTAATNGTINATTGTVTVGNAVSSVTVTCFSALYDHYLVRISGMTSTVNGNLALQFGGITGSVYNQLGYYQTWGTATMTGYAATATTIIAGYASTGGSSNDIEIRNPFLSVRKFGNMISQSQQNQYSMPFYVDSTSSATAFTISVGSGTMTGGTIRVYGYRN